MGHSNIAEVVNDVSMLKLTVFGNEHTAGLVTRVEKVEATSSSINDQIKGAVTTLKILGSCCLGFITIVAAICEIYRAMK